MNETENQDRGFGLEDLSTDALELLLRQDLDNTEPNKLSADMLKYIVNILNERKRKEGTYQSVDMDVAFHKFLEKLLYTTHPPSFGRHQHILEAQPPWPLDHSRHWKRCTLRRLSLVAAVVGVLCAGMITAQALGFDVFGAIGRWTNENFHFETISSAANGQSEESRILRESLDIIGVTDKILPTQYPDGFEMSELAIIENEYAQILLAPFEHPDGRYFSIQVRKYTDATELENLQYEKSDEDVELYERGDMSFYIMANLNTCTAAWTDGLLVESISGSLTRKELKSMIDSIGGQNETQTYFYIRHCTFDDDYWMFWNRKCCRYGASGKPDYCQRPGLCKGRHKQGRYGY